MRSSPAASSPSLTLSRSTTVQVQQPKRELPQLGVLVSIWMGHPPFGGVGVEFLEGAVVVAPGIGFLQNEGR